MSGENHEEIPRSSDALFENNPKVFELPLFSSTSLEDLVRKSKLMGWLVILRRYIYSQVLKHTISTSCCLCCGALFITKPRKKLEVDLTHVRKAEKVY